MALFFFLGVCKSQANLVLIDSAGEMERTLDWEWEYSFLSGIRELSVILSQSLNYLGLSFMIFKMSPDGIGHESHSLKDPFNFQTRHFCQNCKMFLWLRIDQLENPAQESQWGHF